MTVHAAANWGIVPGTGLEFTTTDTKLYVPVFTLCYFIKKKKKKKI